MRTFKQDASALRGNVVNEPKSAPSEDMRAQAPEAKAEHVMPTLQPVPRMTATPKPVPAAVTPTPPPPHTAKTPTEPATMQDKVETRTTSQEQPPVIQPVSQRAQYSLPEDISIPKTLHTQSILTDSERVLDIDSGDAGTIIRDTKRKRFRLFPAIGQAVAGWFTKRKDAYEKAQQAQVRTVAKAEDRVQTIRAAVRKDTQAPREDFASVAKRKKQQPRPAMHTASTIQFKDKSAVPKPTWTHLAEPATEAARPQEAPAEVKEKTVEPALPQTPSAPQPTVQEPSMETVEPTAPEPKPAAKPIDTQEVSPARPEVPAQEMQVEKPKKSTTRRFAHAPAFSPRLRIMLLVMVPIIASVLGVGASYYFFVLTKTPTAPIETPQVQAPSLVRAQAQVPFSLPDDRATLLNALRTHVEQSSTVTQFYPTVMQDGIVKPADAEAILATLEIQAPGAFVRSIDAITFGTAGNAQPFMVLESSNFDTAFAGMLQWEAHISADLAPLFGEEVTTSFDAHASSSAFVRNAYFKDAIASNRNVRVLLDAQGNDAIIYTFIDQNTILITTTREALAQLLVLF